MPQQQEKTVRGSIRPTSTATTLPPSFERLVLAWAGSLTGDGLRVIALPLLAVSVNASPAAVAAVAVASTLPWLLVAIPAGALVDRFNPAKVMSVAHLVRALLTLVLVGLVVTGEVNIPVLCAIGFTITSAETFADGSAQSLLVRLVPRPLLERANARFVTVETLALDLAGPLAAGVLFLLAPWSPFAVSAVCFLVAAGTVGSIRTPPLSQAPQDLPRTTLDTARAGDLPSPGEAAAGVSDGALEAGVADLKRARPDPPDGVLPDGVIARNVPGLEVPGQDVPGLEVPGQDGARQDGARRGPEQGGPAGTSTGSSAVDRQGAFTQIRAGLARLVADPVLRVLVFTVAIMVIANAATDAVLVLYGTETLGMSDAFYPTLLVAYSIGTLIAATMVGRRNSRLRGGQVMIVALFGISGSMLVLGLFPHVVAALAAYAVMGLAGGTWNVLSATRRQRRTPHAMIGRVSSAFRVVAWGVIPLGAALGGLIGERWGVTSVFLLAGGVIAVLGLVVARSFVTTEPGPTAPEE